MHNTFCDRDALIGIQLDGLVFEIDQELTFEDEEKFIVVVVFVPVVFAFDDAEANYAVVYVGEGLVEPLMRAFPHELVYVHTLEVFEFYIEVGDVVELIFHGIPDFLQR
jgi:hypothetical protein